MGDWTHLEAAFHENVAPRFTGLDYDKKFEIKTPWNVEMDKREKVYDDYDRVKIFAHKRETWVMDDYDVFVKCEFYVDDKLVKTIKDF
jgi:hypothetical protein